MTLDPAERFHTELQAELAKAIAYSPDPSNVQDHLDSWAARFGRLRVRLDDVEIDEESMSATLSIEMIYAEPKLQKARPVEVAGWVYHCSVFIIVAWKITKAVLWLGAAVGLFRLMAGL